jgi:hypothetical protein
MNTTQKNPIKTSVLEDRQAWSNDAFAAFCEMYQTGKLTLDQFCALISGGSR